MPDIPALTISQPYAHLIVHGEKRIENRTWPTRYRGPLLIHAGKGTQYRDEWEDHQEMWPGLPDWDAIPKGAIIGICDLVDCVTVADAPGDGQWDWAEGPWCFVLANVRAFAEPVPCRGAQGFWKPSGEVLGRLKEVAHA